MNVAVISLICHLLSIVSQGQTKAVLQNGNVPMRYYVFPMENWEIDALKRQSRQQQGTAPAPPSNTGGNTQTDDGTLPIAGTAVNVINILNGLANADVRPILIGSTAFIPGGDLREGVSALLLGLAPNIQQLLFGNPFLPPSYSTVMTRQPLLRPQSPQQLPPQQLPPQQLPPQQLPPQQLPPQQLPPQQLPPQQLPPQQLPPQQLPPQQLPPQQPPPQQSPRPQQIRATTKIPESPPATLPVVLAQTPTPQVISEEETDPPQTAPPLPPPTSSRPSTTTSAESEEEPEDPVAALSTTEPSEVTDPETERVAAIVPESSQSTPATVTEPQAQPEARTTTTKPATPTVGQLKVVLEDTDSNSIVTANVVNNSTGDSKQYFYLVLLPEEYDQLTKLEAMSKTPKPQRDLEVERGIEEETESSPPSAITARTSRPRNRNRTRTTTITPPHLQLNYYYQMTSTPASTTTTTTTTYKPTSSTDVPGVQGFQNEDDEFEPKLTIY